MPVRIDVFDFASSVTCSISNPWLCTSSIGSCKNDLGTHRGQSKRITTISPARSIRDGVDISDHRSSTKGSIGLPDFSTIDSVVGGKDHVVICGNQFWKAVSARIKHRWRGTTVSHPKFSIVQTINSREENFVGCRDNSVEVTHRATDNLRSIRRTIGHPQRCSKNIVCSEIRLATHGDEIPDVTCTGLIDVL